MTFFYVTCVFRRLSRRPPRHLCTYVPRTGYRECRNPFAGERHAELSKVSSDTPGLGQNVALSVKPTGGNSAVLVHSLSFFQVLFLHEATRAMNSEWDLCCGICDLGSVFQDL